MEKIGAGFYRIAHPITDFQPFSVTLEYFQDSNPDSANLKFWLVDTLDSSLSYAIIDNLSFGELLTGDYNLTC